MRPICGFILIQDILIRNRISPTYVTDQSNYLITTLPSTPFLSSLQSDTWRSHDLILHIGTP